MRVEARECPRHARRLGLPDVLRSVDHLALQVGKRDDIVIDEADRTDAGRGEILQQWGAEPTAPTMSTRAA